MIKPALLRAALVAAIPSLATDPDKLTVFIDQGSIVASGTPSASFEYRYVVNALALDFSGDSDLVMLALIEWARSHQPDLLSGTGDDDTGICFEVDILNNATVDLSITMQLSESVVVSTDANGQHTLTHVNDATDAWTAP
ncbi:MAG: phage tail protein [Janthinobacterium lividum]